MKPVVLSPLNHPIAIEYDKLITDIEEVYDAYSAIGSKLPKRPLAPLKLDSKIK